MALRTILRRLQSPLFQAGDLAFDCEVEVRRGGKRTYTKARVAAGVNMSDHSFREPREYGITAAVSGITQIQNLGRPGQSFLGAALGVGLDALESLSGIDFSTRVADFEARLDALLDLGDELEIVSKVVGRRGVLHDDLRGGPARGRHGRRAHRHAAGAHRLGWEGGAGLGRPVAGGAG